MLFAIHGDWLLPRMLPQKYSNLRGFFDLSEVITRQIMLLEAKGNQMCVSSHGWLITLDQHRNLSLLNHFSRIQKQLPHSTAFRDWNRLRTYKHAFYMQKCVLSRNHLLTSDYVLMVIYGSTAKLEYCKAGDDKVWTSIDTHLFCYHLLQRAVLCYKLSWYNSGLCYPI